MDNNDLRARREQPDYPPPTRPSADAHHLARDPQEPVDRLGPEPSSGYTLMVAGRRTGKTSFLRLLLDTSVVSPAATNDQLAAVARFVQGCAGFTPHIRSVSVNIDQAVTSDEGVQELHTLNLTLIDTPCLDFSDEQASQRILNDVLRHLDARFSESVEDERKAYAGNHHVHLCVYFIDPGEIVPPAVTAPPAPMVSRTKPDLEPVILEPPVTTNPTFTRLTLPQTDISAIRRLSARVNVLPVIARADMLSTDRLAAVKIAVRRDLAAAGIGFGIFDGDAATQFPYAGDASDIVVPRLNVPGEQLHAYTGNGSPQGGHSPSATPLAPSLLRLPFALISPDVYSHSDGVNRPTLQRHELVHQYTPSSHRSNGHDLASKISRGRFLRSYRWGTLDCMDLNHCDFLHLRGAIFYHMRTLQKYTREYLLEKFRLDCQLPPPAVPQASRASPVLSRMPQLSQGTRPILAIDTAAPNHLPNRHPSHSISHSGDSGLSSGRTVVNSDLSPVAATSTRTQRVRTKKINVACNFCRSRKLKCDGGRPACSQCFKRSHPCDYTPNHKRRGGKKRKSEDGSDSDLDLDLSGDPSAEMEPSMSPEISSQPHSRRSSNAVDMILEGNTLPPIDRRDQQKPILPPISHSPSVLMQGMKTDGYANAKHELPPIATLPMPHSANEHPDMSHTLAPLRNQADMHPPAQQRRRTSSAASTKGRQNGYGSKIVACNFCRARKTRCDGGHPACGSCARRSLPCNYVNDPSSGNPKGRPKTAGAASAGPSAPPSSRSSPTAQTGPLAGIPNGFIHHIHPADGLDFEQKRIMDLDSALPPSKKMRITDELSHPQGIAIAQAN